MSKYEVYYSMLRKWHYANFQLNNFWKQIINCKNDIEKKIPHKKDIRYIPSRKNAI